MKRFGSSANNRNVASIIGVGASLGLVYYAKTTQEQAYKRSIEFSKHQVKKVFTKEFPKPVYDLPRFERKELYLDVLDRSYRKIVLIEGASGTGKTTIAKELAHAISSSDKANRKGVIYFSSFPQVLSSREFFDSIVRSCDGFVDDSCNGYEAIRRASKEICLENEGRRNILVIDDAQKISKSDEVFKDIIGLFRGLIEDGDCDVILVVSNGSILKKMRRCSGLSSGSRLTYLKWPHIPDELMKQYLLENREKIFGEGSVSDSQINRFVRLFDSSFMDLQTIRSEKDFDKYISARLLDRKDEISIMRSQDPKLFDILEKIYKSENHTIRVKDLEVKPEFVDQLVDQKYLSYLNESSCVFHDRLTLEAMAEVICQTKKGFLSFLKK
jgi:type II secretory pathway predicted ATPase ExeA